MSPSLPFTVIGGYLGAGKTTLVNHLLTNASGLRIAVLVNDFGSVNIDADLIRSHDGETISLSNGCMCCSLVNGFAQAVGQIRGRADNFDHMVIEASGVADPAKIAQYGQMYELPLDGIVVLADAEQVRIQAVNKYVGDTVVRQFAQADLIVINKTDLVSPDELASLRVWLAKLAPAAPIIEVVRSEVPFEVLLGARGEHAAARIEDDSEYRAGHSRTYETWTVERAVPVSRAAVERFATRLGSDIYRGKGIVCLVDDLDQRYIYQQVGARWSLEPGGSWSGVKRRTRLVVIGRAGAASGVLLDAVFEGGNLLQSRLPSA